jgi:hypothetical protein
MMHNLFKFLVFLIALKQFLGHCRNDTFGPYFDEGAIGYQNEVHNWPLIKDIGSLDIPVKFWWQPRYALQNPKNREFLSPVRKFFLS